MLDSINSWSKPMPLFKNNKFYDQSYSVGEFSQDKKIEYIEGFKAMQLFKKINQPYIDTPQGQEEFNLLWSALIYSPFSLFTA